ncbi:MAG TPA: DUF1028 domain-containing protein [Actinomycetota bacterium]|nr:DUF1028 domain-containing protein [Actinomycetota bacterium]
MTYSIVARDPDTGDLGVAVQSRWFSVGSVVSWAEAGVGAVATQSLAELSYGPEGLDLMRSGTPAPEALQTLLDRDERSGVRQVAMVDSAGGAAVHSGPGSVAAFGHRIGEGYSCQANMMARDTVWDAMARAFEEAGGDLATRLMAALRAAEAEGGDMRGRQSAAILVVGAERGDRPWERRMDLRVEDHPDPVAELERLVTIKRAYDLMEQGEVLADRGDFEGAAAAYGGATDLVPDDDQALFWHALILVGAGDLERARELMDRARAARPEWASFLPRVADAGLFVGDPDALEALLPEGGGPPDARSG